MISGTTTAQTGRPAPAHEAAAGAVAVAGQIMRQALARAQTTDPPEPIEVDCCTVPGTGGHGKARAAALAAIATVLGCQTAGHGNDASRQPRLLFLVGTRSAVATVQLLLPGLQQQIETTARAATQTYTTRLRFITSWQYPAQRRTWIAAYYRSYVRGYGYGIAETIEAARTTIVGEAAGTGAAVLLARDAARVQAVFTREFPGLRPTRRERHHHAQALAAGRQAGHHALTP
ncbi:MAG: hypothetical protein ACRDNF_10720 [Streptosporangiaceae bacterium]